MAEELSLVWVSVLVLRLLLLCLSPIRLSNSTVASRKWAKKRWMIADAQCARVSPMLRTMFVEVVASPSRVVFVTLGGVDSLVLLVYIRDE